MAILKQCSHSGNNNNNNNINNNINDNTTCGNDYDGFFW